MNKRLKDLRKSLDITQQEFANRLGIKRNTVATYESGKSNPSDAAVLLICREFGVNEEWLRYGNGEMFKPAPNAALDALTEEYHLTPSDYALVEKFVNLKAEKRAVIVDYILEAAYAMQPDSTKPESTNYPNISKMSIDEKVELYRQELYREEKATGKSEAS